MSQTTDHSAPVFEQRHRMIRALEHAGVGVDEMARHLGVTRQTVGRWLHGQGSPKLGYVRLWALRCGVPLGWLLEGDTSGRIGPGSGNLRIRTPLRSAA